MENLTTVAVDLTTCGWLSSPNCLHSACPAMIFYNVPFRTHSATSFYAHPEIRDHFVTAEGKKDVVIDSGRRLRRRPPTGPELLSRELEKTIRTNVSVHLGRQLVSRAAASESERVRFAGRR